MANQKIAIIGSVGIPGKYGGFETLAHQLVRHLGELLDITVYCSGITYKKADRKTSFMGAKLVYLPLKANGLQSILYDIISIFMAVRTANTLLVLGVSGAIVLPLVRVFTNRRIVINIDGQEWRRAKWGKFAKMFLQFSERVAVKFAHEVIADNKAIQKYVSLAYGEKSSVVEYGGNHANYQPLSEEIKTKYPFLIMDYAFSVCRIEPENNVHMILKSFSLMPLSTLVFVGNWNYSEYGKKLKEKYGKYPNIHLLDPIYEENQLNMLRANCQFYIHGHSAGGTNPSLVEAMYLGLPVLAYDVVYNRETTEYEANYFKSEEQLIKFLKFWSDSYRAANAMAMKTIAYRRYLWGIISSKYYSLITSNNYNVQMKPDRSDPPMEFDELSVKRKVV